MLSLETTETGVVLFMKGELSARWSSYKNNKLETLILNLFNILETRRR